MVDQGTSINQTGERYVAPAVGISTPIFNHGNYVNQYATDINRDREISISVAHPNLIGPAAGLVGSPISNYSYGNGYITGLQPPNDIDQERGPSEGSIVSQKLPVTNPFITVTYYKMRGYYSATSAYEVWININDPTGLPPSGHTLSNIAILSQWTI